jgi:hypothetical protein
MAQSRTFDLVVEWAEQRRGKPFHYSEVVDVVRITTGRTDENLARNLLRSISRNPNFERVGRGEYRYKRKQNTPAGASERSSRGR